MPETKIASSPPAVKLLGIDWSHTRNFAVYDGQAGSILPLEEMLRLAKEAGAVAIEQGAPISVLYRLVRTCSVFPVPPHAVAEARKEKGLDAFKMGERDDLADAEIIWGLVAGASMAAFGSFPPAPKPLTLDDDRLRLVRLYHEYSYALRGQVALGNLHKAMRRHFGDEESGTAFLISCQQEEMERRAEALKAEIAKLAPEPPPLLLRLKGFSRWLWAGIVITADPKLFPSKGAYRKFCGLIDRRNSNYRFNRQARRAYWLVVDQFIKQRTPGWRELYDEWKEKLSRVDGYTHPHGGATNRVATAFANYVWAVVRDQGHSGETALSEFQASGKLPFSQSAPGHDGTALPGLNASAPLSAYPGQGGIW